MVETPTTTTAPNRDEAVSVHYVGASDELPLALERAADRLSVSRAPDPEPVLEAVRAREVDCVVLETSSLANPIDVIEAIVAVPARIPVAVVTDDESLAAAAIDTGAIVCIGTEAAADGRRLASQLCRAIDRLTDRHALERDRARFRAFTEDSDFGVVTIDDRSRIRYANETLGDILGYDASALEGESLATLMPDSHRDEHFEAIASYLRTGERTLDWSLVELPARHADGHEVPIAVSFGEATVGGTHQFTGVIRDISDRKALEHERDEILDRVADGYLAVDSDGRCDHANDRAAELLGRPVEELVGDPIDSILPTDDGSLATDLDRVRSGGTAVRTTEYVPGSNQWLEIRIYPDRTGLSVTLSDVTDLRRAERDLEANVSALEGLYEVATDTASDFEAKITTLLDLGREHLDLPYGFVTRIEDGTQSIVHAKSDHDRLQPGESCPLSEAYCRKTVASDGIVTVADAVAEGWEDDPAYQAFELGSYVGSTIVVDGETWGTLCFAATEPRGRAFTDAERTLVKLFAQWLRYELTRRRTMRELERQNERLEEFAGVVSHDLRNPLTVARGYLETARADGDGAAEPLAECETALDRMEAMIDDLLALARQGESVADAEAVDLGHVAAAAWEMVETDGATLDLSVDTIIRADRDRLQECFENLFRNALEHGVPDDGSTAELTVTVGETDDGFFVADSGPGIPPDERETVFDVGYTTASDGTGFGLGIVSRIVDAHDWSIEAGESDQGGARFDISGVRFVED